MIKINAYVSTLTFRIFFLTALLFLAFFIALYYSLYYAGQNFLHQQIRLRIENELSFLYYEFREDGIEELIEETEERIEKNAGSGRFLYNIRSEDERQIFDVLPSRLEAGWATLQDTPFAKEVMVKTLKLPGGYRLSVGYSTTDIAEYRHAMFASFSLLTAVAILISLIAGYFLASWVSHIFQKINAPLQQATEGKYSIRVPEMNAGSEVEVLRSNLNKLFSRTDFLIANLTSISANLAHDLRAPLTRLRNKLEQMSEHCANETAVQSKLVPSAMKDLDSILELIQGVLQLSEIRAGGLKQYFTPLNFSRLLDEVLETYQPLLEGENIEVSSTFSPSVLFFGHSALLKQVVVNLLENVISHSGGDCRLALHLSIVGSEIVFFIRDDGRGLPSNNAPHLMQSLKAEPSERLHRQHYGIGLEFVKAIVELHDGIVRWSAESPGFQCVIRLPSPANSSIKQ